MRAALSPALITQLPVPRSRCPALNIVSVGKFDSDSDSDYVAHRGHSPRGGSTPDCFAGERRGGPYRFRRCRGYRRLEFVSRQAASVGRRVEGIDADRRDRRGRLFGRIARRRAGSLRACPVRKTAPSRLLYPHRERRFISHGAMPGGYAVDDGAALHFVDAKPLRSVSSRSTADVRRIRRRGGRLIETKLQIDVLD